MNISGIEITSKISCGDYVKTITCPIFNAENFWTGFIIATLLIFTIWLFLNINKIFKYIESKIPPKE